VCTTLVKTDYVGHYDVRRQLKLCNEGVREREDITPRTLNLGSRCRRSGQLQAWKLYVIQGCARPRAVVDILQNSLPRDCRPACSLTRYPNRAILAPECGGQVNNKINSKNKT
jgi:hypothetical protein